MLNKHFPGIQGLTQSTKNYRYERIEVDTPIFYDEFEYQEIDLVDYTVIVPLKPRCHDDCISNRGEITSKVGEEKAAALILDGII